MRMAVDDLSLLDDEELIREEGREALRQKRDDRKAAAVLIRLLLFAAFVAAVVVGVGLTRGNDDLVHAGLVALATACGAFLHRVLLPRRNP